MAPFKIGSPAQGEFLCRRAIFSLEKHMRKGQVAIFAIVTFVLSVLLFSIVMPVFNRVKSDNMSKAYSFLLIPFGIQLVWFAAGAVYSVRSKHREVVFGILWGFALEFASLVVLIVISASAHF
jgi:hypothetical protein